MGIVEALELDSPSPESTLRAGEQIGRSLQAGAVVFAYGELGAGKTIFACGLARGLGVEAEITSPSFTLIHEHAGGRLPFIHIDLYRIPSAEEALSLDLDAYFSSGAVCFVEWPEVLGADYAQEADLRVEIEILPDAGRKIRVSRRVRA